MELTIELLYHHNKKISAEKHLCTRTKIKPVAQDDANTLNESQTVMSENASICKGMSTSKEANLYNDLPASISSIPDYLHFVKESEYYFEQLKTWFGQLLIMHDKC